MATPQAVSAVIRAARPEFRSTTDKVAFAVHAIILVNGFSLHKVGDGVDEAAALGAAALGSAEEADIADWNPGAGGPGQGEGEGEGGGGAYSFLYTPEPGATRQAAEQQQQQQQHTPLLMLKCLPLHSGEGDSGPGPGGGGGGGGGGAAAPGKEGGRRGRGVVLLTSLADIASAHPPVTLELDVDRYAPSLAPGASGYEQLPELISRVQRALEAALDGSKASAATATTTASTAAATGQRQQPKPQQPQPQPQEGERRPERDPLLDDRYPPPGGLGPRFPGGRRPLGVGDEDLLPGGLPRIPGMGGVGGGGLFGGPEGLMPLGPRGAGGGMHVGPDNPIFAGRMRHPPGGPGLAPGQGGGVPGMRWDPINPEGLQGWSPDDFVREGRPSRDEALNDIGRPPPGRGPDWDHMFG